RIDAPLPPGTYYVGVMGFGNDSGTFALTPGCGTPSVPPVAPFGASPGSIVNSGEAAGFLVAVNTDYELRVAVDTSSGTLSDPMLAVLDGTSGLLVLANDDGTSLDSEQSQRVGPGPYWVIVRDYGNNFGSFDLRVEPPLWTGLVGGTRVPLGREKDGDLSALFATALSLPPTPIIPGLIDGFLLVDLNTGLVVGTQTVPADGSLTWIT